MSQKTITNVSPHARPLDAGPVLGPGETTTIETSGKGDQHYVDLGELVIRDGEWSPPDDPAQADLEAERAKADDDETKQSRGRGGKAGAQ